MPTCVKFHHPGRTPMIQMPNEGGLCLSHYLAHHRKKPEKIKLIHCPGAVIKVPDQHRDSSPTHITVG